MGHQWFINEYDDHCIGKNTDNDLKNTKGILVSPSLGRVWITTFLENGVMVGPLIDCSEDDFQEYCD